MDKLRVAVRPVKLRLNVKVDGLPDQTGAGRLMKMRQMITGLFRYERLETTVTRAEETRSYAELLLQEAMRYGPRHKPTMELMDFWMLEKDLIHRVFKVYVPRFARFEAPYTKMWYLPTVVPGYGNRHALLELKGNAYPPVEPRPLDNRNSLANVLLAEAKRDYVRQKIKTTAAAETRQEDSSDDSVQ